MKQKAFSLIELMTVVAIIAILAATGVVLLGDNLKRTRSVTMIEACLPDLMLKLERYRSDFGTYPTGADPIADIGGNETCGDYYTAGIEVPADGSSYLIYFKDTLKPINGKDYGEDVWATFKQADRIYHVNDSVTKNTEPLPSGWSVP